MTDREHKRPYWHVDAKWICGLSLLASLGAALVLLVAAQLTAPGRGVEFGATVIASAFSHDGLDAPIDTSDLKRRLAASPTGTIAPIDGFPSATITAADLNLSPHELRLKIFRQIAQPVYDKGVSGAAAEFTKDAEKQKQFESQAFALQLFTRQMHDRLRQYAWIGLGASALLLAGVAYFSFGWGRLGNPGSLLLTVALPGVVLGWAMVHMASAPGSPIGTIVEAMVPEVAKALRDINMPVAVVGLVLMVAAGIGKLATGVFHRRRAEHEKRKIIDKLA